MPVQAAELPIKPCLVTVRHAGRSKVALWSGGRLRQVGLGLDGLLRLTAAEMRSTVERPGGVLDLDACELLAPVDSQEVWACGVTYARSRSARMEESSAQDIGNLEGRPNYGFCQIRFRSVFIRVHPWPIS